MEKLNVQFQSNHLPVHNRLQELYKTCPFCEQNNLQFKEEFYAFFNSNLHIVFCNCGFFAAYDNIGMEYIYGRKDKSHGIHCHSLLKTKNELKPYGFSPFGLICFNCDYQKNCSSCGVSQLMTNYSSLTTIMKHYSSLTTIMKLKKQSKPICDFCQSADTIIQLRMITKNEHNEHMNIFKPLDTIQKMVYNRKKPMQQDAVLYQSCLNCNSSKTIELDFTD